MTILSEEVLERRRWKSHLYQKLLERSILKVLPEYIKPGTVIDVGGNTGYQAVFHAQYNPVVSYEPVPELADILKENLDKLNTEYFVQVKNLACGSKYGKRTFYVDSDRLSMTSQIPLVENHQTIEVETVSLDDEYTAGIFGDKVSFLKIDVEGFELDVLEGSVRLIKEQKPTCMVEIYQKWCDKTGGPSGDYFEWFFSRNYNAFYYDSQFGVMRSITSIEEGEHAVKKYHHKHDGDFLFVYNSLNSK